MSPETQASKPITPQHRSLLTDSAALFSGLNVSDLDVLLSLATTVSITARRIVCRKGEPGDALYVVISGKLKVTAESDDGRELIVAILDAGETFGEMSLLDGKPRSASVVAVHDSELLVIHRLDFLEAVAAEP